MDAEEVHHLADQAKALKDDPAFQAAVLALRQQWHSEAMVAKTRDEREELNFRMRALESLPQQLQVFMNDWMMVKRKMK